MAPALRRVHLRRRTKIDRSQWDIATSFDAKAVLPKGLPRNALQEDIERLLSGCNFDPSSFQTFLRRGDSDPARVTLVRFTTRMDAMCMKNFEFHLPRPNFFCSALQTLHYKSAIFVRNRRLLPPYMFSLFLIFCQMPWRMSFLNPASQFYLKAEPLIKV